jgi:PP-loop superfamily ATP-utilizing enzyme
MIKLSKSDKMVEVKIERTERTDKEQDLVYRLRKRAEIRRQIPTRKSVQENQPDRIADLLEDAADEIERLREYEPDASYWRK